MKQSTRRTYSLWDSDRKALLPYGVWRLANGDEILFNRRYEPIYARDERRQRTALPVDLAVNWTSEEWFYEDATPWFDKIRAGLAALAAWEIPPPKGWMKRYAPKNTPRP